MNSVATLIIPHNTGRAVSGFLDQMAIGDRAEFKHIGFNIKIPYPFGKKRCVRPRCAWQYKVCLLFCGCVVVLYQGGFKDVIKSRICLS
jgi:hypothetical protein